ncbi:hypothetical protein KSY44_08560 [Bacteroides eggerthii]|jgi:hypothetical protein|nr:MULTISPECIES: hypothetical protein [Bacteroides]MBU8972065.1 hypothetical protein [Bacteroides eggerthii]MBU8996686.1 hypothetical protein [Bacteroides eggerthii]MBV3843936.1 hypothetical protein [Bacteroides eggerthii]MBV3847008.1 hypothetical protein [Bacteroides eggerthii]MBV3891979.1 hypothetical protein [Bacteroides eggerthii]
MDSTLRGVYINVPQADMKFLKELVKKMGWTVERKESLLKKYISKRPSKVDLSDDDIMEELKAVRYKE